MTKFISLLLLSLAVLAGLGLVFLANALPSVLASFQERPEDLYITASSAGLLLLLLGYWGYGFFSILLQRVAGYPGVVYFVSCVVASLGLLFGVMGLAQPADQLAGMALAVVCLVSALAISWFTHENRASLI